jgi:hypothetical protein
LVDRTRARIFEIFMGEIEEQTEILDNVPSKIREAGWYGLSERRIERHADSKNSAVSARCFAIKEFHSNFTQNHLIVCSDSPTISNLTSFHRLQGDELYAIIDIKYIIWRSTHGFAGIDQGG